jgi:acyl-CoA synthetase (AMP-forming)/AMP-acid ligase II
MQRPARWLQAISSWKATTSGGPTYAYELCLKAVREEHLQGLDLSSWATAYCGSEKVRTDVLEEFSTRFAPCGFRRQAIRPCFGLAEATLLVSVTDPQEELIKAVAADASSRRNHQAANCGRPARETSVIIVDPDSRTRVEDSVVGEIWIQGPHVALGYWNAANVAEESFQQRLADGSGAYLRTGDLGFLRNGQLFVVGRLKDTIIINGLKHSAEDIESTAVQGSRYFSGFTGAAFAIDREGHEHAMLVQEIGRSRCDVEELDRAVEDAFTHVTRAHGIRLFDFVVVRAGSLPRTSSGKVRRSHAREMYLANRFERLNRPPFACHETFSGPISV